MKLYENIKNRASKVAHKRPQTFFHSIGPAAQTSPELIFHIMNTSQDSSVSLSVDRCYQYTEYVLRIHVIFSMSPTFP